MKNLCKQSLKVVLLFSLMSFFCLQHASAVKPCAQISECAKINELTEDSLKNGEDAQALKHFEYASNSYTKNNDGHKDLFFLINIIYLHSKLKTHEDCRAQEENYKEYRSLFSREREYDPERAEEARKFETKHIITSTPCDGQNPLLTSENLASSSLDIHKKWWFWLSVGGGVMTSISIGLVAGWPINRVKM